MSSDHPLTDLANLLVKCGVGWLLNESSEERLRQIRSEIELVSVELEHRLAPTHVDLFREMLAEADAMKPLVQLFASPTSKEMRAMAYCVLRGMDIAKVDFTYAHKTSVRLVVTLENAVTGQLLTFESSLVWDAEIIRHFGIMSLGKKPVMHGFYAFAS